MPGKDCGFKIGGPGRAYRGEGSRAVNSKIIVPGAFQDEPCQPVALRFEEGVTMMRPVKGSLKAAFETSLGLHQSRAQ